MSSVVTSVADGSSQCGPFQWEGHIQVLL